MDGAKLNSSGILLMFAAALLGSCGRSTPEPSPAPAAGASSGGAVEAADAACALPLRHFAAHQLVLVGSLLDYPTNLLTIDRRGGIRWNSQVVAPQTLREYMATHARLTPPVILRIVAEREAPCAVVQETLATAIRIGRCGADRCAFEWPGAMAPPPAPSTGPS